MSSSLNRLNKLPTLEELASKFPVETVPPFGRVVIVPLKALGADLDESLRKKGHSIMYQSWRGQSCGFVVLDKQHSVRSEPVKPHETISERSGVHKDVNSVKSEKSQSTASTRSSKADGHHTPTASKPWTEEDVQQLRILYSQKKPIGEIASLLHRSEKSVQGKLGNEIKSRRLMKTEDKADGEVKPEAASTDRSAEPAVERSSESPVPTVEQILSAATLLHASGHRKVCSYLLTLAQNRILEEVNQET